MEHRFREHNKEADHVAGLAADSQCEVGFETPFLDRGSRPRALRTFFDGSAARSAGGGAGCVIQASWGGPWRVIFTKGIPLGHCNSTFAETKAAELAVISLTCVMKYWAIERANCSIKRIRSVCDVGEDQGNPAKRRYAEV